MKLFAAAALALAPALALAAPQAASAQQFLPNRIITNFDEPTLVTMAAELGAQVRTGLQGEQKVFIMTFSGGATMLAYRTACDDADVCTGLRLIGLFEKPASMSDADLDATIDRLNRSTPQAKFYRTEEGKPVAERFVIANQGVTLGNLRAQFATFRAGMVAMGRALYPADQ